MQKVSFKELKIGDSIILSNSESEIKGIITGKPEYGSRGGLWLNLITPLQLAEDSIIMGGIVFYLHHKDNEYYLLPEPEIEEDVN